MSNHSSRIGMSLDRGVFPGSANVPWAVGRKAVDMALRVLVVDDNERFLEAVRRLLEREGVIVVGVARTGLQALDLARELRPDVTLVDIDLGDESGFDLARRLDRDGDQPSNVILISTHAVEDFADIIAESPALGFLSKTRLSAAAIGEILARRR